MCAYASASDVSAYTFGLLGTDYPTFTTDTHPMLSQVNTWLSSGCSIIEAYLHSLHYATPIAPTTGIYSYIKDLNSLYAATRAELSRTTATVQLGERTRGQIFDKMFWDQLNGLKDIDLTAMGVEVSTTSRHGKLFVGGISQASKDSYVSDNDRVQPRFSRGLFDFPGTLPPSERSSDDE